MVSESLEPLQSSVGALKLSLVDRPSEVGILPSNLDTLLRDINERCLQLLALLLSGRSIPELIQIRFESVYDEGE